MAKNILGPNSTVTINGTDISDHVTSVSVGDTKAEIDVTGFNSDFTEVTGGLRDASIDMTVLQDYASGSVDALISNLYYNDLAGTIKVNPDTSGTVVYTLIGKPYSWSPVSGGVGDANSIDVTWRNTSGTVGLTRGTA